MELNEKELQEKIKSEMKKWDIIQERIRTTAKEVDIDPATFTPALMDLYAKSCLALDMPFDHAVHFAMKTLSMYYEVKMVEVEANDDSEGATKH